MAESSKMCSVQLAVLTKEHLLCSCRQHKTLTNTVRDINLLPHP